MTPVPRSWLDWAIAGLLTVLGVLITLDQPGDASGTIVDSIVIASLTAPLIWRRRAPLAAAAGLAAGTVVSAIPTFDQTRCGVTIPAALLILFSLAARRPRGEAVAGLGLVLSGMVILLLTDPQLDDGALFVLPLCAGVWWMGRLVRSRNRVAAELAERSRQLAETREDSARLAVEVDRAAIVAELETAARGPLRSMVALAAAEAGQNAGQARAAFADIERQGRESLNEMRQILGKLRSDEPSTTPQPTLADLDTLLADAPLVTAGVCRSLPAGTELAAYRAVQHGLEALPGARVELRYLPEALELEVRGSLADSTTAEAALAAARERVTAHGGTFSRERGADRACVLLSRFPVAPAGG